MTQDLTIFSMAKGLAAHAAQRQGLVARNVANADTRNFRAEDVKPFVEVYRGPGADDFRAGDLSVFVPLATQFGHGGYMRINLSGEAERGYEVSRIDADSPNGNSVSLEDQMVRGAEAKVDHELALGVLRKSMDLLRMAITKS